MRHEPAISFRGALRVLGQHDRAWLGRLDKLLGGVLLGAGAAPAELAFAAVWGWVDQKNEAVGLVRTAVDAVSNRLDRTGGLARHELVIAAHTTIVLSSFLEVLREESPRTVERLDLSKAEEIMLTTGVWQDVGEPLVRHLYLAEVPAPSAACGFEENVALVRAWAVSVADRVRRFVSGLLLPVNLGHPSSVLANLTAERYRSHFLALAASVPEFRVWSELGEHAATRTVLTRLADLLTAPVPAPPTRISAPPSGRSTRPSSPGR